MTSPNPTYLVLAGFYEPARHAIAYADALAQAVRGKLVLLHVNEAAVADPYALVGRVGEQYHRAELQNQADTAAALHRVASGLHSPATVEMANCLLPETIRDLVLRHQPALFVLGQPDEDHPDFAGLAATCAEMLQASHNPLLVVPTAAPAAQPPLRLLVAADEEPFALAPTALALRPMLALLSSAAVVAHVSDGVENSAGCSAAFRAVRASGLLPLTTPELRGYAHTNCASGLLHAVHDTQADLLVVLVRQRTLLSEVFHRSVTAQLLKRSPVPVLLLPTAGEAG